MFRKLSVVVGCSIGFVFILLLWSTRLRVANAALAAPLTSAPPPQSITSPEPIGLSTPTVITNSDDRENATPTAWWIYSGQTATDVVNTINTNNARIVDIYLESLAQPRRFTVTYVSNTGAYAKDGGGTSDVDETDA